MKAPNDLLDKFGGDGRNKTIIVYKTWACDPEYVVIRWFKSLKEWICGKK